MRTTFDGLRRHGPLRRLWVAVGVGFALLACGERAGGAGAQGEAAPEGFVAFQGGEFWMGSPSDEPGRRENELRHRVTIEHGFLLQTTEVTRAQWQALMGTQPWGASCAGDTCPVETVNWFEAAAFANARSVSESLPECYRLGDCNGQLPGDGYECATVESLSVACGGYRLPTEAEWEYAARSAGLAQRYPWGDAPATCERAVMWEDEDENGCGSGGPLPVCSRPDGNSAQGVCDLAGNVWEWVEDWYGPYGEAPVDGSARRQGALARVGRGGSWDFTAAYLRAAYRYAYHPGARGDVLGFRLARSTP